MDRQKDRFCDKIRNAREAVMGTPESDDTSLGALHQASEKLSDLGDQAEETAKNVPEKVTSGTRGNP